MLTLLLSTNNSEVQLFEQRVDVYIIANDGKHHSNRCNDSGIYQIFVFVGKKIIVRVF